MSRCEECLHFEICDIMHDQYGISKIYPSQCGFFKKAADVVSRSNEGAECPICHGTGRIGTTDWLTKHVSKEQLAKEKAEAVAEYDRQLKAEVAREIFEEIEKFLEVALMNGHIETPILCIGFGTFFELEKKYVEEQK